MQTTHQKKNLSELDVLGHRLDSVRNKIALLDPAEGSWRLNWLTELEQRLLNEWRQCINDYDSNGYRNINTCEHNAVRVITPANYNHLNG